LVGIGESFLKATDEKQARYGKGWKFQPAELYAAARRSR